MDPEILKADPAYRKKVLVLGLVALILGTILVVVLLPTASANGVLSQFDLEINSRTRDHLEMNTR
jgi:hypothetical protein